MAEASRHTRFEEPDDFELFNRVCSDLRLALHMSFGFDNTVYVQLQSTQILPSIETAT